jgi:hypothetical protein
MIKDELQLDTQLVEGGRGEFTVWVGDQRVATKDENGFPSEGDIVAAVRRAVEHR